MTNEDLTTLRAELDRIDGRLAELQPRRTEAHASINNTLQAHIDGTISLEELQAGQMQRLAFDETYNALTDRRAELEKAIADGLAQLDREGVLRSAIAAAEDATEHLSNLAIARKKLDAFLESHGFDMMNELISVRDSQHRFRATLAPVIAKYEQRAILLNRQTHIPSELAAELESLGLTEEMLKVATMQQILLDLTPYEEIWLWIQNLYAQPGKRELLKAAA